MKKCLSVCLMVLLSSCKTVVPEYHYERTNRTDTVWRHDSIVSNTKTIIREADSAQLAELGLRLRDGERAILILRQELQRAISMEREAVHDTVAQVDSLYVPIEVEKQLSRWESLKMEAGGYVFALLCVMIVCIVVVWWLRKRGILFRKPRDGL